MKKDKKQKAKMPFRMNLLFLAVFLLFSLLVVRLGVIQIVYGDDYVSELERTENVTVNTSVPRGKMYDRYGKVIVDNVPLNAITYTRYSGTTAKEMLETAEELNKLIKIDTKRVTDQDKKDFWLLKHPEEALEMLSDKEKELKPKEQYKLQISRVKEEDIEKIIGEDLKILAIFREFNSGMSLTPQIVKNKEVTKEEYARVSEHLDTLPGVEITTDWNRTYAFDETLQTVLGKVSSSDEGLPADQIDYYLARDYKRNDRVGKSYLEKQYEDVLQGQKAKVKNITHKGKVVETEVISEGERGKDLLLTIDMELQLAAEEILEKELLAKKRGGANRYLDRAFVVLMDPNTGEVLTMAGKQYVVDKKTGKSSVKDFALGNISTSYTVGSSVKGATILTGYQAGALYPGQVINDQRMNIKGLDKGSYASFGNINDLSALQKSSNVYMFKTAIALGGGHYIPGQKTGMDTEKAFSIMRNSFASFGLGVRTGIDLPNETAGIKGSEIKVPGKAMDFAIGQYDTFTPMQLAQYVSTIANGGNRMKPHLVKEIHNPINDSKSLGPVYQQIQPTVLNRLDMKDEWIKRVQTGFRMVMQPGGTGYANFSKADFQPAGKTGTAQAFYDGPNRIKGTEPEPTMNLSLVGYAPYNNPEVAFAVVVPWAYQRHQDHSMNKEIGYQVMDKYFELKKERQKADDKASDKEKK
ncbi:peptidoglycan D,D-transpeptidase FtsI family protein [Peribacillus sp.]|uniref:peptidoglycan D,D-transpeptidase FtsI family protein n=1 Tax=Peribacillus sp. TaxID=2675267 RepID=UPI003890D98E